jgi:hypothetical protein
MRITIVCFVLAAACGEVHSDAPDAAFPPADASAPPVRPVPGRELAVAAGHVSGGTWSVDVHIGSLAAQSRTSAGTWTVRGGTPINP